MLTLITALTLLGDAPRPNIVFVLADDLGRADCGFMGGRVIQTPHLDRLAAAGTILDAFYVQQVCSPTRAALMTGRYPMRHGLQVGVVRPWAQYGLPLEERTLAQALSEAGYATGIFGKWHLGHVSREYLPTRRGFQKQYGHYNGAIDCFRHDRDGGFDWHDDDRECRDEGYSTDLLADRACRFIREHHGRKPFFCYVPFNAVHAPLQVTSKHESLYPDLKGQRRKYAQMLTAMDEAIGRIVAAVAEGEKAARTADGVSQETLFIFSSDNGGPGPGSITDNGPYRAGKGTLYEGGVRVAAFATWKGRINAGATVTEPLHIVDWYPTLLTLAGARAEQPLPVDGRNLWPTIAEGKPSPHDAILLNATPAGGAVRAGKWKLVVRDGEDDPDNGAAPSKKRKAAVRESVELFDLAADPSERTNLAATHPGEVTRLREILHRFAGQAVRPKSSPKPKNFVSPKVWGETSESPERPRGGL